MVFDWSGGPLPLLAMPARFGGAAVLGDGRQWAPWIHLDDTIRLIATALDDSRYSGSINAVAPDLVTQSELTHALAWQSRMPQWLQVPAWPLRLAMGEMSDLFLAGQRVEPDRLRMLGFRWTRPTLPEALDREAPADAAAARPMPLLAA